MCGDGVCLDDVIIISFRVIPCLLPAIEIDESLSMLISREGSLPTPTPTASHD